MLVSSTVCVAWLRGKYEQTLVKGQYRIRIMIMSSYEYSVYLYIYQIRPIETGGRGKSDA